MRADSACPGLVQTWHYCTCSLAIATPHVVERIAANPHFSETAGESASYCMLPPIQSKLNHTKPLLTRNDVQKLNCDPEAAVSKTSIVEYCRDYIIGVHEQRFSQAHEGQTGHRQVFIRVTHRHARN